MSKSVKRGCIALLAGTVLSVTMGVQGAKADQLDDQYNYILNLCDSTYQERGWLTSEEVNICNLTLQYQARKRAREQAYAEYINRLQMQQDALAIGANPITFSDSSNPFSFSNSTNSSNSNNRQINTNGQTNIKRRNSNNLWNNNR